MDTDVKHFAYPLSENTIHELLVSLVIDAGGQMDGTVQDGARTTSIATGHLQSIPK